MAAQNALGVVYVRLRIADTHRRNPPRLPPFLGHLAGVLVVAAGVLSGLLPALMLLPFAGFLVRAGWAARAPRPIEDVRRFGFAEVAVEILGGLLVVLAYV
jgi:hypothetical protein